MQSSHTTQDLTSRNSGEYNRHQPVKQVRSHGSEYQKQRRHHKDRQHSPLENHHSMSSSFRHSIRNLTSCTLRRRKANRIVDSDDQDSSTTEPNTTLDDENRHSPKALLIPARSSSLSPAGSKCKTRIESSISATGDIISAGGRTRKSPVNTPITPSTASTLSSIPTVQPTTKDDTSLPNLYVLPGKEISTSLVNLMGTASDSVVVNNTIQMPVHEDGHISSTTTTSVEQTGLLSPSPKVGPTNMIESPSTQRLFCIGNHHQQLHAVSSGSYSKTASTFSWCYERSTSITVNDEANLDTLSPRLEIDDKPLVYREQFEATEHFNWYGVSDIHGPVIISYKYSNDQDKQRYVMAIVRTRQRTSIESISDIPSSLSTIDILRRICEQCFINDVEYFDPILCHGVHDLLIKYDESYVSNRHKFGIIYQRENQITEEDIFSNEAHSASMDKFLDFIGQRVKLKNFQGFRGGLDVQSDHTGTESIYEQFHNHEIMFHVSTLLPHSKIERQQLERKRHIGNDIVAIVFQENETLFNPECITSQFLHVYVVVTPLDSDPTCYKVSVIHRDSVPMFGPSLNHSNLYHCDPTFKQWLLTKLINAEMASCKTSTFQKYQERTRMSLFDNLYDTLHENNRPFMNFIFARSQYKHECEVEQQKEDAQLYTPTKSYDRHSDNSLLGSVRRRFITSKLRSQSSITPPPTTIIVSTPAPSTPTEPKSKSSPTAVELKHSASKECVTNTSNNGKISSIFFSSKNHTCPTEKSGTSRSFLEPENIDFSFNSRANSKFLSPDIYSPSPSSYSNCSSDSSSPSTFSFGKLSTDDMDLNANSPLLIDDLQSSSKDDLIKYVVTLHQQHLIKLAQMDENHSKAVKQLETQLAQQRTLSDVERSEN